jgi:hypothetical protein
MRKRRRISAAGITGRTRSIDIKPYMWKMGKMSEVYIGYLEERRYNNNLTQEEWLKIVAYTKDRLPKKPTKKDK